MNEYDLHRLEEETNDILIHVISTIRLWHSQGNYGRIFLFLFAKNQ